jgi:ABC-type glycerol-3-phosphate transport system substrate-binding protein
MLVPTTTLLFLKNSNYFMTNFRLVVTIIFGASLFVGVIMLSFFSGAPESVRGEIVVWGTIPERVISPILQEIRTNSLSVSYEEKRTEDYGDDLVEAFASGKGPDVFLLPHELTVRFADKIFPVPEEVISARSFKDLFIEEGEVFRYTGETLALPLVVDPLIMYWNRDVFASAGISTPPEYWTDVLSDVFTLTVYDSDGDIIVPGVPLGEFVNIDHAKDIVSTLLLQTGSQITASGNAGLVLSFIDGALESVFRFYTEFARPGKDNYTWNRSFDEARDMFIAGDVPIYFGYASEISGIASQNPHLNMDVSQIPQLESVGYNVTYGEMLGVAIARTSRNKIGAQYVQAKLASPEHVNALATALGVAPAVRTALSEVQDDVYKEVYYKAALVARAWLDPDAEVSYTIFKDAVEDITSGRARLSAATNTFQRSLQELIREVDAGE